MEQILVTGGTGTLGRVVVEYLLAGGAEVRVLSRRPRSEGSAASSWAIGDLRKGHGIEAAVAGTDVIIHCASQRGDIESARHLINAARAANAHVVYISIVGVDQVPLGYYKAKLGVEQLLEGSGLPWTILRTTQFHNLIVSGCDALARLPVMAVPARMQFQPIEVREVAARLVELAAGAPAARVPDMGGPQALTFTDLARSYLDARRRRRAVVPIRIPGATAAAFRRGDHLALGHAVGQGTFGQFLAQRFPPTG